jgi:pimeloyl-ACP methyl ester carboxylesterase
MSTTRHEVRSPDGTLIPVWISGAGRPLLVVHGAISNHEAFDLLRGELEKDVTFAALDRRGTFSDPNGRHELERDFEDVAAVAESLGPEMDLFGHSSGAVCSLGASLLVSNLRRLVLYEPPMTNTSEWLALSEKMDRWQAEGNVDAIFAAFIGGGASLPTDAVNKLKATPFGAAMFSWAHTLPRETHAMTRWSHNSARYSSVTAPTLYLKGAATPADRQPYQAALKGVMPNFTMREIPNQGHMAHVLAAPVLAQMILEFVQS